jgi:peptide deformylase
VALLPLVKLGVSKILEQASQNVTEFGFKDKKNQLDTLAENMFETMYNAKGVGLAAPQVGIMLRVAVIDISAGEDPDLKLVLVNPEIKERRGTMTVEEGCLSIPGRKETIERSAEVLVEAKNTKGEVFTVWGKGLLAQALQHEIDHLNGKLFLSYVKEEEFK